MKYEIEKWFAFINWQPKQDELHDAFGFFSSRREPVRSFLEKLSWNATKAEQLQAIDYLTKKLLPQEYVFLILAHDFSLAPYNEQEKCYFQKGGKDKWENAAKTIVKIGWPRVDSIVVPLFIWLLDPNWPGSLLVHDFLLSMPKDNLQNKMRVILENPENYDTSIYEDLIVQIGDLCQEAGISF